MAGRCLSARSVVSGIQKKLAATRSASAARSLFCDFSELFAKSIEARITRSFRKGNRNRLGRPEGRRGRLRAWSCRNRCLGGGFGLGEDKIPLDCAYHRDRNDEAQTKT